MFSSESAELSVPLSSKQHRIRRDLVGGPAEAKAWTQLAIALIGREPSRSVQMFYRAHILAGNKDARSKVNYALSLESIGRNADAEIIYRGILEQKPGEARSLARLLGLLAERGDIGAINTLITDQTSVSSLPAKAAWKLAAHISQLQGAEKASFFLIVTALKAPGEWIEPSLALILKLYDSSKIPEIPIGSYSRKRLILVPGDKDAMGFVADDYYSKRGHKVKSAAWYCQRAVSEPENPVFRNKAIKHAYEVRWPRHAIAQMASQFNINNPNLDLLEKIIELFPDSGWADYGISFGQKLIATDPAKPQVWDAVLRLYKNLEAFKEADQAWQLAIQKFPNIQILHYNRGIAYLDRLNIIMARQSIKRAVLLDPKYAKGLNGLGLTYNSVEKNYEAASWTERASVVSPYEGTYYLNLGAYYRSMRRFSKAIRTLDKAIRLSDDEGIRASAAFNASMTRIMLGETKEGFQQMEARWATPDFPSPKRNIKKTIWRGPIEHPNSDLLVYMEQGLGDEIMYSWYIPYLLSDTKRLVIDCDPRIVDILSRSFPGTECIPRSKEGHALLHDLSIPWKTPMAHVPQYYAVEVKHYALTLPDNVKETIPRRMPGYIKPDLERIEKWKGIFSKKFGDKPLVAVSWRSKIHSRIRDQQYMTVGEIARSMIPGSIVINLQYSVEAEEIEEWMKAAKKYGFTFVSMSELDLTNDLEDIFAILKVVDCTVSTLISLAWMSGAVGTPALIFRTSWEGRIWHQQGFDFVPWQPSMRLYFKTPHDTWERPIVRLHETLKLLFRVG